MSDIAERRQSYAIAAPHASEAAAADHRARGSGAFARFACVELVSLALMAGAEWIATLTSDRTSRGRCLPDVRMMRPPGITREEWLRNA